MRVFFIWLFTVLTLVSPLVAQARNNIEFILDVSGSMEAAEDGEMRLNSARNALTNALNAGSETGTALPILAQRYAKNHLGGTDLIDMFTFSAQKGEKYFIGLIPADDADVFFEVVVADEYKQKLISKMANPREGLKTDVFVIPETGTYTVMIKNHHTSDAVFSYVLDLKKTE